MFIRNNNYYLYFFILALITFSYFSCSSFIKEDESNLSLTLVFNNSTSFSDDSLLSDDNLPHSSGTPPKDVTDFTICITADDIKSDICKDFSLSDNPDGAGVKVKPGDNRTVTLRAYNKTLSNEILWSSRRTGVLVKKGQTKNLSMHLTRPSEFTPAKWRMGTSRAFHTAIQLENEWVVLIGGIQEVSEIDSCGPKCRIMKATSSIDAYDPVTDVIYRDVLELIHPRAFHTATIVDKNKVLIAGGCEEANFNTSGSGLVIEPKHTGQAGSSVEILDFVDLKAEVFNLTDNLSRAGHKSFKTKDGNVFLIGGYGGADSSWLDTVECYNCNEQAQISLYGNLSEKRFGHIVLHGSQNDLLALIWGGNIRSEDTNPGNYAEIFDLGDSDNPFSIPTFLKDNNLIALPVYHGAGTELLNGGFLISGGIFMRDLNISDSGQNIINAEAFNTLKEVRLINIAQGKAESSSLNKPRWLHTMTTLLNGNVLIVGGEIENETSVLSGSFNFTGSVELYSSEANEHDVLKKDEEEVKMIVGRGGHSATLLKDGTVLISGGLSGFDFTDKFNSLNTLEIYNSDPFILD